MRKSAAPSDRIDLGRDLPTSDDDVRRLREIRSPRAAGDLVRMNDLSATRIFPTLRQRKSTSAGREPFVL